MWDTVNLSPGCSLCPRAVVAKGKMICTRCEAERAPTPLREWRALHDKPLTEIAEETGLAKRTVLRADAGERVSHDAAMALARCTGLHWRKFRPKET